MTLPEQLYDIGAIKFGSFTLKSGIVSPIYIDLRVCVSYPRVLQAIADAMWEKVKNSDFRLICGVPYTALPIATAISLKHDKAMVMRRKEVKDYGTKKAIEGAYTPGDTVLVIEDLITSGASVMETVEPLINEGLKVADVVVLIDREQGGKAHLKNKGLNVYAVMTISELLADLEKHNKLAPEKVTEVNAFIAANQI